MMPNLKRASEEQDSGSARKRTAGSSRTGQACDRCKVRKIRCDATPGGCTPCLQNGTECKTTDRITGRATARGHAEILEHENTSLKMYVIELQSQLRQSGQEPGPPPNVPTGYAPPPPQQMGYGAPYDAQPGNGYGHSGHTERQGSQGSLLPEFRSGCIGDNYLGVASENNWLTTIEGTSLALFGAKIDLIEYVPPEPNPELSASSYQTFLSHAFGQSGAQPRPDLPSYDEYITHADVYFRTIQVFIPVLHKSTHMNLLARIYHEGHQATASEEVMVHMLLAIMFFQYSVRNQAGSEQLRDSSFKHYHYALSLVPQLIIGHKVEDIQALALICSHLRSQPRPGAAWMFTNMVLGIAIESGLHRSAKSWPVSTSEQDAHAIEMRKRVFWTVLVFHVQISGKLGRPMPLRVEDFDIEIPEAVNDNLPGEPSLTKWKNCSFRAAIQGFRLLKIKMQVYSTIYSIKSSNGPYEVHVRQLEKEIQAFQAQIPPELAGGAQTRAEDHISAIYIQLGVEECQLLLHHPSLNRSHSPQTASTNLDICLDASNKMLMHAKALKEVNALDTTWYYTTDFLAAIFTTLFAYNEKRDQVTQEDVQHLRDRMESWLDIMHEIGRLLGTGPKLQEAIRNIVEYSLSHINRHLTEQTASAAMANVPNGQEQPHQQHPYASQDYYTPAPHGGGQFTYPEPQSMPQYNAANYDTSAYNAEGMRSNIEAQLNAELGSGQQHQQQQAPPPQTHPHHQQQQQLPPQQPQPTNFMAAFQHQHQQQQQQQQHTPGSGTPQHAPVYPAAMQPPSSSFPQSGPAAWRHFADSMIVGVPEDTSQNVPGSGGVVGSAAITPASFGGMQMPADGTQAWPLIQYEGKFAGQQGRGSVSGGAPAGE